MQGRSWINAYVGIPFADGGRTSAAADCWGLFRLVYAAEASIILPSHGDISAADLAACCTAMNAGQSGDPWLAVETPQMFDGVLMRRRGTRDIGHVGIYAGPGPGGGLLLHTELASGAVCVPLNHHTVSGRIIGFRRHRDLARRTL